MKCPKCGADMPDRANFCTKCGEKLGSVPAEQAPVQAQQPTANAQPPQQPTANAQPPAVTEQQQPKHSSFNAKKMVGFLSERFMPTYVIVGVITLVFMEFSALFVFSTYWLGILCGVFAILCAFAFCLLGIYRFFALKPRDGKRTNADIICYALGIIVFVFVLITSVVVMVAGGEFQDFMEVLSNLLLQM